MAVDKHKLEDLLKELPEDLQSEVLEFAELLLKRSRLGETKGASDNGTPSVRTFFGAWDSGDPRSADNDRIDTDLAREYGSAHEADS